jgi:hypothetical protein
VDKQGSMTVEDLISILSLLDKKMPVYFQDDDGLMYKNIKLTVEEGTVVIEGD